MDRQETSAGERVIRCEYCIRRAIMDLIGTVESDLIRGGYSRERQLDNARLVDLVADLVRALDLVEGGQARRGCELLANAAREIRASRFPRHEIAARNVDEAMGIINELIWSVTVDAAKAL